jgi:hypothetical protein
VTHLYDEILISGDIELSCSTAETSPRFKIPKEFIMFGEEFCCAEFNQKIAPSSNV